MSASNDDEVPISSSNSSVSRLLPRIFHHDVQKNENRMIMPLPSDFESSDLWNAQQREEANMKRLVQMAKHQQSLIMMVAPANESPRRRQQQSLSRSTDVDDGPVDVDCVRSSRPVDVDSISEESTSSTGSFKMRSFLQTIQPSTPTSVSASEKTMRISNVTDIEHGSDKIMRISNVNDIEHGTERALRISNVNGVEHAVSVPEETRWRPMLVGGSLVCLLVLAIIVVIVSVTLLQQSQDSLKDVEHTFGPTFVESSSTPPSMAPLTNAPLTGVPSQLPSVAPSTFPTLTLFPTVTPKPTASQSPTSIFSTRIFDTLKQLSGEQLQEQYGHSVALSGDGSILAVGAPYYSHNDVMQKCGRVQVFERSGTEWKLKGETLVGRNSLDQFGYALSLSEDGTRLAVSEPYFHGPAGDRSGNVRVFDFDGEKWSLVGQEIGGEAAVALFGHSLALAGDGTRLAVGSPYYDDGVLNLVGRVSIFELEENSWQLVGQALDGQRSLDWFGWSVDLSQDGNVICVGAPRNTEYGGYARCFQWKKGAWTQVGSDIINDIGDVQLSDRFGMAVSLSPDGTRVAIGSPWKDANGGIRRSGLVAVYELTEQQNEHDEWRLLGNEFVGLDPNSKLGSSLDLSGEYLSIGILGLNRVSVHRWTGLCWDTVTSPLQSDRQRDDFGYSIAMSNDGTVVIVGATENSQTGGKGYARVLERL